MKFDIFLFFFRNERDSPLSTGTKSAAKRDVGINFGYTPVFQMAVTLSLAHRFTFILANKVVRVSFTSSIHKCYTFPLLLVEMPPNLEICAISSRDRLITKTCSWNGRCAGALGAHCYR